MRLTDVRGSDSSINVKLVITVCVISNFYKIHMETI